MQNRSGVEWVIPGRWGNGGFGLVLCPRRWNGFGCGFRVVVVLGGCVFACFVGFRHAGVLAWLLGVCGVGVRGGLRTQ